MATHVVAGFLKRLSQLALISPLRLTPAFLVLVRNGLKRHPKCAFLIHRRKRPRPKDDSSEMEVNHQSIGDPYKWNPSNLTTSGAMESSLWEVASLQHHYAIEVTRLAHEICHPKPNYLVDSITPGELIQAQDKLLAQSIKSVQKCLRTLSQSNADFPKLGAMNGWVSDLASDSE
ncbi:unnamed protein product [Echinostoma caproni]|uniref:CCAAT-binding factor domain-containing protein n=1 Tax=Echinostoma caproni TaxID=27848 RepID=A0A3P8GY64_9TREM|nr:unnamed protein product [Echinostoma caproni]